MRYDIDPDTFAVSIFNDGENVPFQFQPDYPNGDKFDSVAEAKAWAEASIAAHDVDTTHFAPNGKDLKPEAKPDPLAKDKLLAKLGLTAAELQTLLR